MRVLIVDYFINFILIFTIFSTGYLVYVFTCVMTNLFPLVACMSVFTEAVNLLYA